MTHEEFSFLTARRELTEAPASSSASQSNLISSTYAAEQLCAGQSFGQNHQSAFRERSRC